MTEMETQTTSDIHTFFQVFWSDENQLEHPQTWGPYLTLQAAVEAVGLLQLYREYGHQIKSTTIKEYLVYGPTNEYVRDVLTINLE